jgi:hypothetical protein
LKKTRRASQPAKRTPRRRVKKNQPLEGQANLRLLEVGLKQANKELIHNSREGVITAVTAVFRFVSSIPEFDDQHLGTPLWTLVVALKDLDRGRVAQWLKQSPGVKSRVVDSWMRKMIKANAIATVDMLSRSGMKQETACRLVAKELEDASFRIGGRRGTPSWKTVKSWRDRISRLPQTDEMSSLVKQIRDQVPWDELNSGANGKAYAVKKLRQLMNGLGSAALE